MSTDTLCPFFFRLVPGEITEKMNLPEEIKRRQYERWILMTLWVGVMLGKQREREGKLSPKPLRNVFIERTQKQTNRNERKRDINRKEPWTSGLVKGREDRK